MKLSKDQSSTWSTSFPSLAFNQRDDICLSGVQNTTNPYHIQRQRSLINIYSLVRTSDSEMCLHRIVSFSRSDHYLCIGLHCSSAKGYTLSLQPLCCATKKFRKERYNSPAPWFWRCLMSHDPAMGQHYRKKSSDWRKWIQKQKLCCCRVGHRY